MINHMPNSIHPTLPPSIIFKGTKIDLNFQKLVPFGTYAALHYAKRVDNKYQSHMDNAILLYLTDDTTSNMTAGIPGRNTVAIINKYTIIKAHPSDFGFQENKNIIPSHIPDFITLPYCPQEVAKPLIKRVRSREASSLKRVPSRNSYCHKKVQHCAILKIKNCAAFPPCPKSVTIPTRPYSPSHPP